MPRVIWRAGRWRCLPWGGLIVASAVLPILNMAAFGAVVGAIPGAAGAGLGSPAGHRLLAASALASGVFLVQQIAGNVGLACDRLLGRRVEAQLQFATLDALARADGLEALEDPRVREVVEAVREVETATHPAGDVVHAVHELATGVLMSIAAGVVLATFRWWAPLALATGWLLAAWWGFLQDRMDEHDPREREQLRRYAAYRALALDAPAAKELRVFGLGAWVAARAERHWRGAMGAVWGRRRTPWPLVAAIAVTQAGANGLVFWLVVRAGIRGEIDLAHVALYLQVGLGPISHAFQSWALTIFRRAVGPIRRAAALPLPAPLPAPHADVRPAEVERMPREEVRLAGVRFRYPGSERDVLAGLDLRIPAGRSVAIVGVNGAGKTTLVKLLTRLYEPDAGAILVDGRPLAELDPAAWRRRIGVIFQDFVRYPLPLRENVTFGRLGAAAEREHLEHAACGASLEPLAASLADGWDTVLAAEHGGTDLSGGQWQRVALARALYGVRAGAGLLILDEPTASLDVRAEAELFDRFLALTRGVSTVLISHRFSTVRRVDLIYVVEHGRVVEHGSHAQLVARGGRYAELFALQAAQFAADGAGDA